MKSKSQISIQVTWIFILIAGAIILFFFISLVYKQKTASEINLAKSISIDLDAIITGARASTGTTNIIQIPKKDITFVCDETESWFGIDWEKTSVTQPLDTEVVFAPNTIKGNELITWTMDFSAPFKIVNLLYLTSPQIRYIFVSNTAFDQEIYYSLPDEINKEIVEETPSIEDKNNYKVKFIFFDTPSEVPHSLQYMPNKDVTAIKITGNTIEFYEKDDSGNFKSQGTSFYLNEELLYGAIFSEDIISYECNLKKAFTRFNFLADVYKKRENSLMQNSKQDCKIYYHQYTTDLKQAAEKCQRDLTKCSDLIYPIEELISNNQNLKQRSCPVLY